MATSLSLTAGVGLIAMMTTRVSSHGSLVIPPSRNNYEQKNPANTTGNPHFDQGPCVGGACLWFSEGCFLGCSYCTSQMPAGGNQIDQPNCTGFIPNVPTLPEKYRTYNRMNQSGNGDWTRYHPWRSPGRAPVSDPCGSAGGYTKEQGGGGETPAGAHQGDKGSHLPPTQNSSKWHRGGTAEVGWMVAANHGGGYLYSLCPKSQNITEGCFNQNPLLFADSIHTIRYLDGRPDINISATDVDDGTFPPLSSWRVNPIPACDCDWGRGCTHNAKKNSPQEAYSLCSNCTYEECGKQVDTQWPAPFPNGYGQQIWNRQRPSATADDWVIVDRLRVPETPGDYVLRWRWDTEQNPQIWTNCADVTIV